MNSARSHGTLTALVLFQIMTGLARGYDMQGPLDFSSLSRRVASLRTAEETVHCVVLDPLVPKQRVEIQFGPPFSYMIPDARETGCLGVLGVNHKTGNVLSYGVQARIESMTPYLASRNDYAGSGPAEAYTAFDTSLVGGRRFQVIDTFGSPWPPQEPVFPVRVRWLDDEKGSSAAIALAEVMVPRVNEWINLVRSSERERRYKQMDRILADLGPMPDAEEADEFALWTAALMNPLPALGVARDIRACVLKAEDSLARLNEVHEALMESISEMERRPSGPFEIESPYFHSSQE